MFQVLKQYSRPVYTRGVASVSPLFNKQNASVFQSAGLAAMLVGGGVGMLFCRGNKSQCDADLNALSPKEMRTFRIAETKKISPDTALIRVALPSEEHVLGMPVASCLSIQAEVDGQSVGRPYTPTSLREQKGYCEFVVKAYPSRTDGKPGGLGRHLFESKAGDSINMKGPWKKLPYEANKYTNVGMIAGGTGLTPMLQVVREILSNPADKTKVTLLFGNKTEQDILLRAELEELAKDARFEVVHTLDAPPSNWDGETGFVTAAMVRKTMPAPGEGTMIMVCGPGPMMNSVSGPKADKGKQGELGGCLKEVGYGDGQWFKF